MNNNNLANNLYELRTSRGMSQEEFADRIGVSRQAVSKWERAEAYPDTENLITISRIYGITIDALIKEDIRDSLYSYAYTNAQTHGEAQSDACADEIEIDTDDSSDRTHIKIDAGGIRVSINGNDDDDDDDDDYDDDDDDDDESYDNLSARHALAKVLKSFPYPVLVAAVYMIIGITADAWSWSWTLFVTVPVYYSLVSALKHLRLSRIDVASACAFVFLLTGMLYGIWHPGWVIFFIIPIYYPIARAIDKAIKRKQ